MAKLMASLFAVGLIALCIIVIDDILNDGRLV